MQDKECLGQRIKALRKSNKLTQEQLAEKIGISTRQIVKIEMGQCYPTLETFIKIAKIFDIEAQYLLSNEMYDDINIVKKKLINRINNFDETHTRFLYAVVSNF